MLWSGLRKTQSKPATPVTTRPFQAISIFRGAESCVMARRFSEYRFLAKDAPPLPLSGCTMRQTCACRYLKHKDRRVERRRIAEYGIAIRDFLGQERRNRSGRRKDD